MVASERRLPNKSPVAMDTASLPSWQSAATRRPERARNTLQTELFQRPSPNSTVSRFDQPREARRMSRCRQRLRSTPNMSLLLVTVLLLVGIFSSSASAAFINFENCLDPNVVNSNPLQLQFIPLQFWAAFNTTDPGHNLNVTVYGNVSGKATQQPYPAPNDPQWSNPTETLGKIVNLSIPNNKYSTLFAKFNVLSYTPYDASPSRFCGATVHGECPLGPVFYANS